MLDKHKGFIVSIILITYLIIMITLHRYPDIKFADLASIFAALTSTTAIPVIIEDA